MQQNGFNANLKNKIFYEYFWKILNSIKGFKKSKHYDMRLNTKKNK